MEIIEYLEKNQQIPYKIFENALLRHKFFHAYLLCGSQGTPLLDIANFLAKSMLCENAHPFACNSCNTCKRIEENNYGDLILIDGKKGSILKDEISTLIDSFSLTASEKKGIKIYIINIVENMNVEATNALLKFLEEPPLDTYAILTTFNKYRILPTILSRCEIINFSLLNQKCLIDESLKLGVAIDDCELLSFFYNDPSYILKISQDEDYLISKNDILELFKNIENKENLRFFIEHNLLPKLKGKETIRYFYDNTIVFFKEALKYKSNKTTILNSYVNILKEIINNVSNLDRSILILINSRNELNFNLNTSLLILESLFETFEVHK